MMMTRLCAPSLSQSVRTALCSSRHRDTLCIILRPWRKASPLCRKTGTTGLGDAIWVTSSSSCNDETWEKLFLQVNCGCFVVSQSGYLISKGCETAPSKKRRPRWGRVIRKCCMTIVYFLDQTMYAMHFFILSTSNLSSTAKAS